MKIPNKAVLALLAVYAVIGFIALGWPDWAWRWLHLVVVLVIGFALNIIRAIGAGDAKFAAVMAPFIALGDLTTFLILMAVITIMAFVLHRMARVVPAIRNATPNWESWTSRKFPMGTALGGALVAYLALGLLIG